LLNIPFAGPVAGTRYGRDLSDSVKRQPSLNQCRDTVPVRPLTRVDGRRMIESLTYGEMAERLGISPEAARAVAKRRRLPRVIGNDGKARIQIDIEDVRPAGGPPAVPRTPALLARIETLQTELAAARESLVSIEALAAGHRMDYERERDRGDRLASDLRAIAVLMARPWWRRLAG
jgi:hypothetical protein